MFSTGFSNLKSWIGDKQQAQDAAAKVDAATTSKEETTNVVDQASGGTKASKLEILGNVKSQFGSWIQGGIAGLRKASESEAVAEKLESPVQSYKGSFEGKDEADNSSATGSADSEVILSEEEGEVKNSTFFSSSALKSAKTFGEFFHSAVNKAGKTVTEAGAKIKKSSLLGDLNKEQEAFIREKREKDYDIALPPWVGLPNEAALKEECLSLSQDRRNFVRNPPAGVNFVYNYEASYPVAMAILAEDPELEKMRFELVPKIVNEETFWRNYFYRVGLICQANELESFDDLEKKRGLLGLDSVNTDNKELALAANPSLPNMDRPGHFLSSNGDVEDIEESMKKLGIDVNESAVSLHPQTEEWEKDLDLELQEYEVVAESNKTSKFKSSSQDSNEQF